MDISKLLSDLNIKDNGIKTTFSFDDFDFWMNNKGRIRRQQAAVQILDTMHDAKGRATGKLDDLIAMVTSAIVYSSKDSEPKSLAGDGFFDFIDSLDELKEGEMFKLSMLEQLPIAFAIVTLGESQASNYFHHFISLVEVLGENIEKPKRVMTSDLKTSNDSVRQLPVEAN